MPHGAFPQLQHELETALTAQGLFPKEAHAMVETWRDSWFEEGSRLLYLVPSREVDTILPLEVEPLPAQTVRVFVGRIELITPVIMRSVEEAVARNDRATLNRYSRFLDPILNRILAGHPAIASDSQLAQVRQSVGRSIGSTQCR